MGKKQFKAESKRLLDLMINSIYTHHEIFLRELISNASDAVDKLYYKAMTEHLDGISREDFAIDLVIGKEDRTLTVRDNGIGMTKEELENNLGVIARSGSLNFKKDMAADEEHKAEDVDIIGQFGVGFYSAFMVSDKVTVKSRAYGSDEAWCWESEGADGYTIEPCEKEGVGTEIVLHIKPATEDENFDEYLDSYRIQAIVKKYSDYIRYPIKMDMERSRLKEGSDKEYETYTENVTLNSMVPLWRKNKSEITPEEYNQFYKEKFYDYEDPARVIHSSTEGAATYNALLFIPARAPYNYYTREYEKGLQLYASGVLIMDKCPDLLPDHFSFVKGLVDSQDLSLNISREMLQHDRQLKVIASRLEKKLKSELLKMQKDDREKYEKFWAAFGRQLKYSVVDQYGAKKDLLKDLLLFQSSRENKLTTLKEYVERMAEGQEYIYYVSAETAGQAAKLPQVERIADKGYEILYLTEEVDEFVIQALGDVEDKKLKSVSDPDALPESDEEKAQQEQQEEQARPVLDFVKETLGDKIHAARVSKILKSAPVCMTADGPMSLEMEKYFSKLEGGMPMKAQRVLELNAQSAPYAALKSALDGGDRDKAAKYVQILYHQALLIAGLPIDDAAEYTDLVCSLMD